ncbi:MAG TPA: Ig-like domain-containing protein, partial [candidate division Zixibacteria bacterium]|nr:Ig-like domain-containing protein [candidate division Zixibacteria bacterium]
VFDWTPSIIDGGVYDVTFYATDADLAIDSEVVTITVIDVGNQTPVLDSIGARAVSEGSNLNFLVTGSDAESIPAISAIGLPAGATFTPNPLGGSGVFDWTPGFATAGAYQITFYATDDSLALDSEVVAIAVSDAGNQAPIFALVSDTSILEGGNLQLIFSATDPDGALPPSLSISSTLSNSTFVDSGNGIGVLNYTPSFFDGGIDTVVVFATDDAIPPITSQLRVVITTFEVNQPPKIDSIGPFAVLVADLLSFTVRASDSTDGNIAHKLSLSVVSLPPNATFVDNGNNTGTFEFTPDTGQVGVDTIRVLAVDQGAPSLSTTRDIEITVVDKNQRPVIADVPPSTVIEGGTLVIPVSATDGDGDPLILSVRSGPANSSFVDNGDGTGVFTFTPSFTQGGSSGKSKIHSVEFRAFDGLEADFELALIQVYDAGNQA